MFPDPWLGFGRSWAGGWPVQAVEGGVTGGLGGHRWSGRGGRGGGRWELPLFPFFLSFLLSFLTFFFFSLYILVAENLK